jgi:hypothetical protein
MRNSVVNVDNTDAVQRLMVAASQLIAAEFPETHHMVRRLEFTEGTASKIEARFLWPRPHRAAQPR